MLITVASCFCPLVPIHYNVARSIFCFFHVLFSLCLFFSTVVLPHLHKLSLCNNQQTVESKRIDIATQLFEAYSALSCCCILYIFLNLTSNCVFRTTFQLVLQSKVLTISMKEILYLKMYEKCTQTIKDEDLDEVCFFIWTDLEKM